MNVSVTLGRVQVHKFSVNKMLYAKEMYFKVHLKMENNQTTQQKNINENIINIEFTLGSLASV